MLQTDSLKAIKQTLSGVSGLGHNYYSFVDHIFYIGPTINVSEFKCYFGSVLNSK